MADKIFSIADGLHDELPPITTAKAGRMLITTDKGEMYYEPEDKKRVKINNADQTYTPDSENAQSGKAVAEAINNNTATNLRNGSAEGSIRSINSKAEDDTYTIGTNATAEGKGSSAPGKTAHAEGYNTIASGNNSHAEGNGTQATLNNAHAEGYKTVASGGYSHAEGASAIASGGTSHAEGISTVASNYYSHAEGRSTKASGNAAHSEGGNTKASGSCSHAEGYQTIAGQRGFKVTACEKLTDTTGTYTLTSVNGLSINQYYSVYLSSSKEKCGIITDINTTELTITVDGYPDIALNSDMNYLTIVGQPELGDRTVSGDNSHVEGENAKSLGNASHAEGELTTASGAGSHAEGNGTIASGEYSHAEGFHTQALCNTAHAEGSGTEVTGQDSHAEGNSTKASGNFSHAEGYHTKASGNYSHAEGQSKTASGSCSHAEGYNTTASGGDSHAEGELTTASGNAAHSEGNSTKASGGDSHAEGHGTTASSPASHAEGGYTTASGDVSHAEGISTTASGLVSHAEGNHTEASGENSHAEGYYTTASGNNSHVEGDHTQASSEAQHVQGKYNIEDSNKKYADIIGNGSPANRSNAATVDWNGNAWFAGAVTSNGADYAEFFEWLDGNPDNEDRVGYLVALDGEKIRFANPEDEILGIISANPAILGDNYECDWNGKYLTDEFGRILYDKVEEFIDIPKVDEETGEITTEKKSLGFFDRPRINPDYDPDQEYINRRNRSEWAMVGMLGKLFIRDDGTAQINGYVSAGEGGIATASTEKTNMRVLSRVNDHVVKVLLK